MVARKTSWDSVPMGLVGRCTIGELVATAMELVVRSVPSTSLIHARTVHAGSWFPHLHRGPHSFAGVAMLDVVKSPEQSLPALEAPRRL